MTGLLLVLRLALSPSPVVVDVVENDVARVCSLRDGGCYDVARASLPRGARREGACADLARGVAIACPDTTDADALRERLGRADDRRDLTL